MINVTCAIILHQDKILITQRSEQMKHPLKWEFPGGKVQKGETEEECIVREIREELNIEIRIRGRLSSQTFNYGDIQITLIPFMAELESGEIHLAEHKEYRMVNKEELNSFDWVPADILVIKEYLSQQSQI